MVRQAIPLTLTGLIWTGSVLLDLSFRQDGSASYLRYFEFSVNPKIRFSLAPNTPNPADADADLSTQWEVGDTAIELVANNGDTVVVFGPAHPDNIFSDPTEPYFWTSPTGTALAAFGADHIGETVTLYLESGVNPTTDGLWSEPIGLLTTDSEWSLLLDTSPATQNSEWSELALNYHRQ